MFSFTGGTANKFTPLRTDDPTIQTETSSIYARTNIYIDYLAIFICFQRVCHLIDVFRSPVHRVLR